MPTVIYLLLFRRALRQLAVTHKVVGFAQSSFCDFPLRRRMSSFGESAPGESVELPTCVGLILIVLHVCMYCMYPCVVCVKHTVHRTRKRSVCIGDGNKPTGSKGGTRTPTSTRCCTEKNTCVHVSVPSGGGFSRDHSLAPQPPCRTRVCTLHCCGCCCCTHPTP